jgi:tRNA(fMet)-specific endonuclease VapC
MDASKSMARTGRYLLDTNIVIALFAKDVAVQQRLAEAHEVFVPSIVLGELYYGAHKSARVAENFARIDAFAASNTVLPCDTITAQRYGDIKNKLRAKGRPIPENDIWIAAIAMQHQLTVVARDGHFHEVDGLHVGEMVVI